MAIFVESFIVFLWSRFIDLNSFFISFLWLHLIHLSSFFLKREGRETSRCVSSNVEAVLVAF